MRYYKCVESGMLLYIGTGPGGTEITEAEYNGLMEEIITKAGLEEKLYAGEITEEDVPEKWRAGIVARVAERREAETAIPDEQTEAERIADMEVALRVLGVIENEDV